MTSEFNESSIVGNKIEMDTKELGQLLITNDNHDNIMVLSIIGTSVAWERPPLLRRSSMRQKSNNTSD
jgi:hypothetical protein